MRPSLVPAAAADGWMHKFHPEVATNADCDPVLNERDCNWPIAQNNHNGFDHIMDQ